MTSADGQVNITVNAKDNTKGVFSKISGSFSSLGKTALLGVGAGVAVAGAAIAGVAIKGTLDFIKFEDSLNEVFTLLPGISGAAMDKMKDQVLDVSGEMGRLPNEVVPALYQSLSAGVPQDNVFEFLDIAHKAALGGVTELDTAVDGISSVMNAYGSDVVSAGKASDIMFTAVRLGKTDFQSLSKSLFNVIPTAASLGVSFEDVSASLAVLTGQGTPTSVATTQIRSALVEASKGGTKLDGAIQDLTGSTFPELIQQGESMPGIFQLLRESMPEQEFKDLFGSVEATNAVLGITGPNFEKTTAAMDEMAGSAGATDAAYDTMNQGMARTLEVLQAKFATTFIKIGDALSPVVSAIGDKLLGAFEDIMPVIEAVLDTFSGLIEALMDGDDPVEAVAMAIEGLGEKLGLSQEKITELMGIWYDFTDTISDVIEKVTEIKDTLLELLEPVIEAASEFFKFQDVLIVLGGILGGVVLGAIISIAASLAPVIAAVLVAVAVVAIMRNAWENNWGGIQEKVAVVIEFIRGIIESVMTWVKEFWAENGDEILAKAQEIWSLIVAAVQFYIDTYWAIIVAIANAVKEFWAANGDEILAKASEIWNAIKTVIATVIEGIQVTITTIVTAISEFWAEHGDTILAKAEEIWNAIQSVIETVTGLISGIVDAFSSAFEGDWVAFGQKLRTVWDDAWNAIQTAIETIAETIKTIVAALVEAVIEFFTEKDWLQIGKDIVQGIADGITAGASWIKDAALAAARAAYDAVTGFFSNDSPSKLMFGEGQFVSQGLSLGIIDEVGSIRGNVEQAFKQIIPEVTIPAVQFEGIDPFPQSNLGGFNKETTNNFNMTVVTNAGASNVIQDFRLLESIAAGT